MAILVLSANVTNEPLTKHVAFAPLPGDGEDPSPPADVPNPALPLAALVAYPVPTVAPLGAEFAAAASDTA